MRTWLSAMETLVIQLKPELQDYCTGLTLQLRIHYPKQQEF